VRVGRRDIASTILIVERVPVKIRVSTAAIFGSERHSVRRAGVRRRNASTTEGRHPERGENGSGDAGIRPFPRHSPSSFRPGGHITRSAREPVAPSTRWHHFIATPGRTRRTRQRRTRKGPRRTPPNFQSGARGPVGTAMGADEAETAGLLSGIGNWESGIEERPTGTVASGAAVSPSPRLVARRGVRAEPSSGRFRVIRPIVVPTGPGALDATRGDRSPLRSGCRSCGPHVAANFRRFSHRVSEIT